MKTFSFLSSVILLLSFSWKLQAAFWMEDIARQGALPFPRVSNYQVYRNVKAFGAKGMEQCPL
jgi:hypothetical protein